MASVAVARTGGTGISYSPAAKALSTVISYIKDYSLIPVLVASSFLTITGWKLFDTRCRKQVAFLWIWILMIPGLLNATSKYAYYYSYMVYVPACVLLILTADRFGNAKPIVAGSLKYLLIAASAAAMAIGLPTRLLLAINRVNPAPRSEITETLRHHINNHDIALVENAVFFEAKSITPRVFGELYCRFRKFSESEKSSVSVLVVYPKDFAAYSAYLGGVWKAEGKPFGDTRIIYHGSRISFLNRIIERHFSNPQMTRFPVQVYRKLNTPEKLTDLQ